MSERVGEMLGPSGAPGALVDERRLGQAVRTSGGCVGRTVGACYAVGSAGSRHGMCMRRGPYCGSLRRERGLRCSLRTPIFRGRTKLG
jgi:hypothetical protein